jgi:hypothetical protein
MKIKSIAEAQHRIALNKKTWLKQKSENKFNPTEYYWYDATPKEISWASLSGKMEDLISAVAVNALPILTEKHGVDAYIVEDNKLVPVELKSSFVSFHTIWQSKDGTLYTGKKNEKNKKSTLKSSHEAKYSVSEDNLATKNMITIIVLMEDLHGSSFPSIIESRRVEAKDMYDILLEKIQNQKEAAESKGKKWDSSTARSIGIKYATMESNSTRVDFDGSGYANWEIALRLRVAILSKGSEAQYAIDRSNSKTVEFLRTEDGQRSMEMFDWSTQPKDVLLAAGLLCLTKNDPMQQTSIPYTEDSDSQQSLDFGDTQPTGLSVISL